MPEIETLKLKVGLNTDTAIQDAKKLNKEIANTLSHVDTSKLDSKMLTFIKNLTAVRDKTVQITKELEELGSKSIPTEAYTKIDKETDKLRKQLVNARVEQERLKESGNTTTDAYTKLTERISRIKKQLEELRNQRLSLVEDGEAFISGKETDEYKQKLQQLNQLNQAENILLQREQERQQKEEERRQKEEEKRQKEETKRQEELAKQGAEIAKETPKVEEKGRAEEETEKKTKKATKATKEHTKAVRSNSQAHRDLGGNLKKALGNILKYTVGITTLVALFRKLRSMATEAFKVMAQEIPEVNTAISDMATAMKQVKASAGTMLQPLLQVLSPIITAITQKISQLMNTIAQLFATLSGQNYIYEATVDYYDYAKSVEEASGALAGFDKLNVVGSGEKNSMALTKDTVHYAKKYFDTMKFADSTLFKTIEKMKKLVDDIGKSFKKAWDNGNGAVILENLQRRLENIIGFINNMIDAFDKAWNTAGIGDEIADTFLGIIADISGFIADITGDLAEWAADLDLVPIMDSLRKALGKVKEFLQPVFRILRKMWKDYLLPLGKWIVEELAPHLLDLATNVLDKIKKVLEWLEPKLYWIMENVVGPIAGAIGDAFLGILEDVGDFLDGPLSDAVGDLFKFIDEKVWPLLQDIAEFLTGLFKSAIGEVKNLFHDLLVAGTDMINNFKSVFEGIVDFLKGVFSGDLSLAMEGLKKIFMGAFNAIIDGIELLINAAIDAANAVSSLLGIELDNIHIKRWGESDEEYERKKAAAKRSTVGYSEEIKQAASTFYSKPIEQLTDTEIENYYNEVWKKLYGVGNKFGSISNRVGWKGRAGANGMVLPPNKPFLAMVGDQTSGTNVETPLSTIEQAVANVMGTMGVKVVFDVKGDPKGLFKAMQREATVYQMQHHGKTAF